MFPSLFPLTSLPPPFERGAEQLPPQEPLPQASRSRALISHQSKDALAPLQNRTRVVEFWKGGGQGVTFSSSTRGLKLASISCCVQVNDDASVLGGSLSGAGSSLPGPALQR